MPNSDDESDDEGPPLQFLAQRVLSLLQATYPNMSMVGGGDTDDDDIDDDEDDGQCDCPWHLSRRMQQFFR